MHIYPEFALPADPSLHTPIVYVREQMTWEYRRIERDSAADDALLSEEDLNALGADGWEMIGAVTFGAKAYFYFKRLAI